MQNLTTYPYPSGRRVVMGQRFAAATSQPLASLAAMEMFWAGGNAVDAAVAMAIALTVVEPTSNGIGSDAFALVWDGSLHGLNASGRSPENLRLDCFSGLSQIPTQMPEKGWLTVTVPGAVSAWYKLWERWGRLPFEQLFAPAIRYAEQGFPVSPETSRAWQAVEPVYLSLAGPAFQPFQQVFFPKGRAPRAGEIWGSLAHAATLREIAATGGESFYRGALASRILAFSDATEGLFTAADLALHQRRQLERDCPAARPDIQRQHLRLRISNLDQTRQVIRLEKHIIFGIASDILAETRLAVCFLILRHTPVIHLHCPLQPSLCGNRMRRETDRSAQSAQQKTYLPAQSALMQYAKKACTIFAADGRVVTRPQGLS